MKRITKWILAATACLTLSVAQMATAQDTQTTTQDQKKDDTQQRPMRDKMGRRGGAAGHMNMMAKELNLTDAQKTQIKGIHEQQRTKMQELRSNTTLTQDQKKEQLKSLRESAETQVNGVLNADQQKKFAEMKANRKERMEKHRKHRRGNWDNKTAEPKSDSTTK